MIDEKEATNGNSYDSKSEATKDDKDALLLVDGSSSSSSSSGGGLKIYTRRIRSNPIQTTNTQFNDDDKMKAADVRVPVQEKHVSSLVAFTNGPGEYSLRHRSNIVSQQMHQSLNGHQDGQNTFVTHQESGCMSVIKKSLGNVERCDNQPNSSAPEPSHAMPCGLSKQSEGSTSSELCLGALSNILSSDKFSELCGLLLKNFGVVNVKQVLDIDAISSKIENGAYETSPLLYLKDIQQVWTKLQQFGNDIITLASNLSDKSKAHYNQFVTKQLTSKAHVCHECGEKAEAFSCLVCDSCEDIYHLSCTKLLDTKVPPLSWYCTTCVSNGVGLPHDNCMVCEKLNASASTPLVNRAPTTHQSHVTNENRSSNVCFMCKTEVKIGDEFRKCGHLLCGHKFYHSKCLTSRQLSFCGPVWYCPSCLCRRCLVDKDDDQIVLCDGCDEAYHIYCASPQLLSIPKGSWFCRKCDRKLNQMKTMRRVYESMQKKVKTEDGSEEKAHEEMDEREGLDMLVNAAKTLSYPDAFWNARSNI